MGYETIIFQNEANIATITLNRPERMNALNYNVIEELVRALEECEYDDDIRAAVITGAGRAFCAGDDLRGLVPEVPIGRIPKGDVKPYLDGSPRILKALMNLPKPVIAMINGHAHGAGFEICLACDFRIASEEATFSQAQVLRGIVPGTVLLPRYVGMGKATELLMLGERFDAREAERLGLVNQVVPAAQLEDTVREFANKLAKGATKAIGLLKIAQNRGLAVAMDRAFEYQAYAQARSMQTEDVIEGVNAFMEKREPRFKGK